MRYFIALVLFLVSCTSTIKTVDHPIDPVQQQKLLDSESSVVELNLLNLSILASIIVVLVLAIWFIAWRKDQNKEADSSS